MKQRGYIVNVEAGRVSIEHRASLKPRTVALLVLAYIGYCFIPGVRKILVDFIYSRDPVIGGFALFMLLIPLLSGATWLFFASGEVMRCDAQELHFARRRTLGRWHRHRFSSPMVRKLRWDSRGTSKSRNYTVLTFEYEDVRYDMLEDLSQVDSDKVLAACKAMGIDAVVIIDEATAMNHDIAQRGWFINPLKDDREERTPRQS